MTHSARDFILQLLREKGPLPAGDIDTYNYFDSGHIDSLGLIKFFMRIEDQFSIEITAQDMSDPALRTVAGMVSLIERKAHAS
jgi:acyl carrier protein